MIDEQKQIYIIVDIEADGPTAGLYSMLSIGAVATTSQGEVGKFYRKLTPLQGASQYPPTMTWWETQPEAWQEATENTEEPSIVINDFCTWVESFGKTPVFVAHPVGFDYSMVSWYLWKFAGRNPFTDERRIPATLDLSSFIAGKYHLTLDDSHRDKLPDWMKAGMPEHTHNALDDAIGYGAILRNVLNSKHL
jgi:DNA polymerase III alpha subunit (gram-positive type)